jgi:photosystem II stability/assembly factor-like uncharacterized protein
MGHSFNYLLIIVISVIVLSLTLVGCSSGSKNSSSTSNESTSASPSSVNSVPIQTKWHVQYSLSFGGSSQIDTFLGLSCADVTHCQAIGGDKKSQFMLGTSDGGLNWVKEADPPYLSSLNSSNGSPPGVIGIDCPSASECFALTQNEYSYSNANSSGGGLGAAILASFNGGATWTITKTFINTDYFDSISCASSKVCYASGDGFVVATFNGGLSWTRLRTVPNNLPDLSSISCSDMYKCVAVSTNHIFIIKNEGQSWTKLTPPNGVTELSSISCPTVEYCYIMGGLGSSSNGFTMTSSSIIISSKDGGLTWVKASVLPESLDPIRIRCVSFDTCYVVGYDQSASPGSDSVGGIYITTDGAKSWSRQQVPSKVNGIQDISCVTVSKCWTIGGATLNGTSQPGNFTGGYILSDF